MATVWINGEFHDESSANVSLRDAGLLHAAGVFTTTKSVDGEVFRLDDHLRRLRASCDALYVPLVPKDDALRSAVAELLDRNGLADARLRITVTRGTTLRDPVHGESFQPTCFITADALTLYPAEFYYKGLTVVLNSDGKLNPYDVQAGHKTLDYFSRFAALRAATRQKAGEALWFNVHNFLQSGSISNVFLVEDGAGGPTLVTPPTNADLREEPVKNSCPYPKSNVLPGVVRAAVIDWARENHVSVQRLPVDVNRLLAAREVFLTNSIMGVMPVTRIEQSVVGDGQPGELTRRLHAKTRRSEKARKGEQGSE